jgi:hypothetical protein
MRRRSEQEPAGRTRPTAGGAGDGAVGPGALASRADDQGVRVVIAGKVERVSALRAARLLTTRAAELPEDVTVAECQAVLAADEQRQAAKERTLRLSTSNPVPDMPDRLGGRTSEPGILSSRGW